MSSSSPLRSRLFPLLSRFGALPARPFSSTPPSQFSRITIIGRLGAEPEVSATSTGKELVRYVLATGSKQTSWFRVTAFPNEGPGRDRLLGLQKGTLVCMEGDAQMRSYEDHSGAQRSALNIVQRSIEVLRRPYADPDVAAESGATDGAVEGMDAEAAGATEHAAER